LDELPGAVLYISYDGILEPLGESQVVSYLERLAADRAITLLSFEKPADLSSCARVEAMQRRLQAARVTWVRLRYHKRPPVLSTAFDVLMGIWRARRACRRGAVRIIHARSYVPALMALGSRGATGASFLFDMRGFWVDEKVEAGHWRAGGVLSRIGKVCEKRFLDRADAIVSLTAAGVRALPELGYQVPERVHVEVIPTCVDLNRFSPGSRDPSLVATLGLTGMRILGSVGTLSNWYMRGETLRFLARAAQSWADVKILFVTREDHDQLRRDAEAAGVPGDRLAITRASFDDMPRFTRLFDAGVFFIRPAFSKRGSAATKLAEFLACGVPVVINAGVGDSGAIVQEDRVGVVLPVLDEDAMGLALPEVRSMLSDAALSERCRQSAAARFDVDAGALRYRRLYEALSGRS
jgi:glycosyltransferase involved in cell wall biosynthesis